MKPVDLALIVTGAAAGTLALAVVRLLNGEGIVWTSIPFLLAWAVLLFAIAAMDHSKSIFAAD
jgi:hypothetical protein